MLEFNDFFGIEIKGGLFMIIFFPGLLFTHLMWGVELLKLTDTYYILLLTITLSIYIGILLTAFSVLLSLIFLGTWYKKYNKIISGIKESKFISLFLFFILNTISAYIGVILFKGRLSIGL